MLYVVFLCPHFVALLCFTNEKATKFILQYSSYVPSKQVFQYLINLSLVFFHSYGKVKRSSGEAV